MVDLRWVLVLAFWGLDDVWLGFVVCCGVGII